MLDSRGVPEPLSQVYKYFTIIKKKKKKKKEPHIFLFGVLWDGFLGWAALERVLSLFFFSLFNETGYIHRVVTLLSQPASLSKREKSQRRRNTK